MGIIDKLFKNKKQRKYEGASKSKRTEGWKTGSGDANTQLAASLSTLRERSRDLRRNNPFAHKVIELIANNTVGKGIQTRITGPNSEFLQEQWNKWTERNLFDYDGRLNLGGMQRLIMESTVESGEVLARRRIVDSEFPIQYQILESDFLSTSQLDGRTPAGNYIIQGVEFGQDGKRVGYHLYETHPGSIVTTFQNLKTNPIPSEEISHIFRIERPGQVRGVPWLSPIMIRLRDLDDFEDAQLMRQKIAALFTAFVHDISAEVECDDTSDFGENLEPGTIEELPPGKTITFANPPSVENYKEFVTTHLKAIAAGLGVSYEAFSGDLSEVNFSSARMGWLEMNRNVEAWREGLVIQHFLNKVTDDFKMMMAMKGVKVSDLVKFQHIPPKREMIDPTKEIPATIDKIRAGLSTLPEEIAALGKDPDQTLANWAKSQEQMEKLGLILKSNPKYTNDSGKLQEGLANEQKNQNS